MFTICVHKMRAEAAENVAKRCVGRSFNSSTPPHCLTARVGRVFARVAAVSETTSVQQQDGRSLAVVRLLSRPGSLAVVRLLSRPRFHQLKLNKEGI